MPDRSIDVDEFIRQQRRMIDEHGLDNYLPALLVVKRAQDEVNVLTEPPDDVAELEALARDWATQLAGRNDFALAFRCGSNRFKVICRVADQVEERVERIEPAR